MWWQSDRWSFGDLEVAQQANLKMLQKYPSLLIFKSANFPVFSAVCTVSIDFEVQVIKEFSTCAVPVENL